MLTDASLLLLSLLVPLLGAALIVWRSDQKQSAVQQCALITSLVTLALVGIIVSRFPGGAEVFAATDWTWLAVDGLAVHFSVGLDGLSIWLYVLTVLLVVVAILLSWQAAAERVAIYYALLLVFEAGLLGVFAARDVVLFYFAFEFTLLPVYFLNGIWGGEERRAAATRFFLYSLAGSLLTLLGILALVAAVAQHSASGSVTFSLGELAAAAESNPLPKAWQRWIMLTLLLGFALRMPLVPLQGWLISAVAQAPAAVGLLLVGALLKLGGYGLLRIGITLLPQGALWWMPVGLWWALATILYAALVAFVQNDAKRLVAYASVSHMGFGLLGLFALNEAGIVGGTLHLVNQGLAIAGLLACLDMLHERYRTSDLRRLGRIAPAMPVLTSFTVLFALASLGLPGLNGSISLYWLLTGVFHAQPVGPSNMIAALALLGVVFTAGYLLRFVQRIFFEQPNENLPSELARDLNAREVAILVPLTMMIVWMGVQPKFFTAPMTQAVNKVAATLGAAIEQQSEEAAHE